MIKFQNILLEGKKENLIDKYKDSPTFSDAPELLEKLIDGDPSATKKYSEWMIKQMISLGDPITFSVADNVNLFIDLIESFHKSATAIKPEDIDYAESTSSFVDASKIKSSPKDINKYSIWGLQAVMNAVRQRQIMVQKEKEVKGESDRIYEDNRFLIVQPYSHGASCYYGAGTKWCTTTKDDTRYFDKYSEEGNLFYIIDKSSKDSTWGKMALFVRSSGKTEVYDQKDSIRSLDVLLDRFSPIQEQIRKLVKGNKHYETLKGIQEGKIDHIKGRIQSDHLVKIEKEGDDKFVVKLKFDGPEEFLKFFEEDVDEGDLRFISDVIDPPYGSDLSLYDPYNFDDDFIEGYVFNYFSDEHLKTLKEIIEIYDPAVSNLIVDNNGTYSIKQDGEKELAEFMVDKLGDDFMSNLSDTYSIAQNEAMQTGTQKEFTEELCDVLSEIGFHKNNSESCFYNYNIDLKDLLELFESEDYLKDLNLTDMLKNVIPHRVSFPIDYPYDNIYNNFDSNTFDNFFNNDLSNLLEKEYDKLDDADFFLDFDQYLNVMNRVKEMFGRFGKNIPIPTSEDANIRIDGVDPETNKVKFTLSRFNSDIDSFETKKGKSKLSSIISLMNNYQLFDPFE